MPSVFHNPAIELATAAHEQSIVRFRGQPNDIRRDAFFVLSHDAIVVHRAIGSLADAGWSGPGGALLRTLMDMNVSALALAQSAEPSLAAFRFLYSGFRRHWRSQHLDRAARQHMFAQIRQRLDLLPADQRAEAMRAVKDRDRPYWFAPEWPKPSALIDQFGSAELVWVYQQLSAAAHGTFLGSRLYRENPDDMGINPEPRGPRALTLDFSSCRFLVEVVRIRNGVEQLGFDDRISEFMLRLRAAAQAMPSRVV
jgi:hypothetical protein